MKLVPGSQNFSFNYTAWDQNPSLFVAFKIYDVTTGTASFQTTVNGINAGFGSYMGVYQNSLSKTFLIIGIVFTDNTYSVPDTSRAPSAEVYQIIGGEVTYLGFAYASYDQNASLNLQATIYDVTTGTPLSVGTATMALVNYGVYFGNYMGTIGDTYNIASVVYTSNSFATPDLNRAPQVDEFDCYELTNLISVVGQAILRAHQSEFSSSLYPPIHISQGDTAQLDLTAVDANGNPIDLSSASLQTFINGPNAGPIVEIDNGLHIINPDQINYTGQYSVFIDNMTTPLIGLGFHKEIITLVTMNETTTYFRGPNLLQVYPPVPFE